MTLSCVNAIVGWQFPRKQIHAALNADTPTLLTLDFDLPSTKSCNLKCKYCFIQDDDRQRAAKSYVGHCRLTIEQLKAIFESAARLGCRSAKLVGDQEPLLEEQFLSFVEYVSEHLKMWLVIFTNGAVLANDSLCRTVHGMDSKTMIEKLYKMRVSIMLKFHSFSYETEDKLVGVRGYAEKRNQSLHRLIQAGFNSCPLFATSTEQYDMTGIQAEETPTAWSRLGLESVITSQCLDDAEDIYRLKKEKRLYVDLDPPVPIGLTRSEETRRKLGIHVSKEQLLNLARRIYTINDELGIPFEGASPYFGGLPCSQLPYSLYINAVGRIYPCCGCPDVEVNGRSDYLGHISEANALAKAIERNPFRRHYKRYGHAYHSPPFNDRNYEGYGIYHGCPYRDRAGDLLPLGWEVAVAEYLKNGQTADFAIIDSV